MIAVKIIIMIFLLVLIYDNQLLMCKEAELFRIKIHEDVQYLSVGNSPSFNIALCNTWSVNWCMT